MFINIKRLDENNLSSYNINGVPSFLIFYLIAFNFCSLYTVDGLYTVGPFIIFIKRMQIFSKRCDTAICLVHFIS